MSQPRLLSFYHTELIKKMKILGYHGDNAGVCFGIASKWLEAFLSDEESQFMSRVEFICKTDEEILKKNIERTQEKIQRKETLDDNDKKNLDIFAFFDEIEVFHSKFKSKEIFGVNLSQQDASLLLYVNASGVIEKRGGIAQLYSEPVNHGLAKLQNYFEGLRELLLKESKEEDISHLAMTLDSVNHRMGLRYNPEENIWVLIDPSGLPPRLIKPEDIGREVIAAFRDINCNNVIENISNSHPELDNHEISTAVQQAFRHVDGAVILSKLKEKFPDINETVVNQLIEDTFNDPMSARGIFNLTIHTTHNKKAEYAATLNQLNHFKIDNLNAMDAKEIAINTPRFNASFGGIATMGGHLDFIKKMKELGINLSTHLGGNLNQSIAHYAMLYNQMEVLRYSAECGLLNIKDSYGSTPALYSEKCSSLLVEFLAENKVDLSESLSLAIVTNNWKLALIMLSSIDSSNTQITMKEKHGSDYTFAINQQDYRINQENLIIELVHHIASIQDKDKKTRFIADVFSEKNALGKIILNPLLNQSPIPPLTTRLSIYKGSDTVMVKECLEHLSRHLIKEIGRIKRGKEKSKKCLELATQLLTYQTGSPEQSLALLENCLNTFDDMAKIKKDDQLHASPKSGWPDQRKAIIDLCNQHHVKLNDAFYSEVKLKTPEIKEIK